MNEGQTHWEGCWAERGHQGCAVAEIERLTAESKAKDVAYETMQEYVTELEARVEGLETELKEWESGALVRGWREIRADREQGEKDE